MRAGQACPDFAPRKRALGSMEKGKTSTSGMDFSIRPVTGGNVLIRMGREVIAVSSQATLVVDG